MSRAAVAFAALVLVACGSGSGTDTPPAPGEAARSAAVVRVLDGDSVALLIDGVEREARLIGVNAPERDECWGPEAKERLATAARGTVTFETDVEATDRYDRLLVYLWTADGTFINADLAATGDVIARAFPPNTARQDPIDEAGMAARASGEGMWSGCASSASGIALAEVNADPPGPDEEALRDEWVAFTAAVDIDLSGWTLRDGSTANRYPFPDGTRIPAGGRLTIRTGCGTDSTTDLHWCSATPIWNNAGDEVILTDADGLIVLAEEYGG